MLKLALQESNAKGASPSEMDESDLNPDESNDSGSELEVDFVDDTDDSEDQDEDNLKEDDEDKSDQDEDNLKEDDEDKSDQDEDNLKEDNSDKSDQDEDNSDKSDEDSNGFVKVDSPDTNGRSAPATFKPGDFLDDNTDGSEDDSELPTNDEPDEPVVVRSLLNTLDSEDKSDHSDPDFPPEPEFSDIEATNTDPENDEPDEPVRHISPKKKSKSPKKSRGKKKDTPTLSNDTEEKQRVYRARRMPKFKSTDPGSDLLLKWLNKYPVVMFDKIAGLIHGALIGEMIGVQFQMKTKQEITSLPPVYGPSPRKVHNINPGDWGVNGDQLVTTLGHIMKFGSQFDPKVYGSKLVSLYNNGFTLNAGKTPYKHDIKSSVDIMFTSTINSSNYPDDAYVCALEAMKQSPEDSHTNAALVRSLIYAIFPNCESNTFKATAVTHSSTLCLFASRTVGMICRALMRGEAPASSSLLRKRIAYIKKHSDKFQEYAKIYRTFGISKKLPAEEILKTQLSLLKLDEKSNIRYVLKTLGCAFYTLNAIRCVNKPNTNVYLNDQNIFCELILNVLESGGDTMTNCSVVGAILGSYLGYKKLPERWVYLLRHKQFIDLNLIRLFKTISGSILKNSNTNNGQE